MCTGFPSRKRHLSVNVHFYHQLAMATHGVRRSGSAAIDLAYVACGRLDAFWEFGLNPWDMAAGRLLVEEAGGRVSDMRGAPHSSASEHLLVDNGHLHEQMLRDLRRDFSGEVSRGAADDVRREVNVRGAKGGLSQRHKDHKEIINNLSSL